MTISGPEADAADFQDFAPCGYLLVDESGTILDSNARLAAWLGCARADLAGAPSTSIFSLPSRILLEVNVAPILKLQGQVDEVSVDLLARDGTKVAVLMSAAIARGRATAAPITRYVLLKAAARKQYERDLIAARLDAEKGLLLEKRQGELREQFVAVLGHDLRNPVASVASAVRMLGREPLSERGVQVLGLVQGSMLRMSRLIDNVLDFARARLGGGIELAREDGADLEGVLNHVVDELRAVSPEREIRADISINRPVACDSGRIGQLLSNLLGNGITHGDPDAPVVVTITAPVSGDFELWVSNAGQPIGEAAMLTLFDPFVRGQTGSQNGLGLGLHIAAEIARAHGGKLSVISTTDETRFTFRLPFD